MAFKAEVAYSRQDFEQRDDLSEDDRGECDSSSSGSSGSSGSWLDDGKPWSSSVVNSLPLQSSVASQALQQALTGTHSLNAAPSISTLLSHLARFFETTVRTRLGEIRLEDSCGDILGEGVTYLVEKRKTVLSEKRKTASTERKETALAEWVAVKCAKFQVPKQVDKIVEMDGEAYGRLRAVILETEVLLHPPLRSHPNIPNIIGYSWHEDAPGYAPMLVMELATFGTLAKLFHEQSISETERLELCLDVAHGLDALHSCGVVHGDVKQANVLVFPHSTRRFLAKLSDFEHAMLGHDGSGYRGTPVYRAPEAHRLKICETSQVQKCDAFAFGLLVFEVFCGGRSYYERAQCENFKNILLEQGTNAPSRVDQATNVILSGDLDTLKVGLDFLCKTTELSPSLMETCREIFQRTLSSDPTERLRAGWSEVKRLLGHKLATAHSELTFQPLRGTELSGSYSMQKLLNEVSIPAVGAQLIGELRLTAERSPLAKERAKASFDLAVAYAVGKYLPTESEDETLRWMTNAAKLGYQPAFIVGERMFQAHNVPVPQVFSSMTHIEKDLRTCLQSLKKLPQSEWYRNAVSMLLSKDEESTIRRQLEALSKPLWGDNLGAWIEGQNETLSLDPHKRGKDWDPAFLSFAESHFLVHWATFLHDGPALHCLLRSGLSADSQTPQGLAPLHIACRTGDVGCINILLGFNPDASINDSNGTSPLHWLIMFPQDKMLEIGHALVQRGANLNCPSSSVYFDWLGLELHGTPLFWACLCRNDRAVRTLLQLGASPFGDPTAKTRPCLAAALSSACSEIVQTIFESTEVQTILSTKETNRETLFDYLKSGESSDFHRWCLHGPMHHEIYSNTLDALASYGIRPLLEPTAHSSPLFPAVLSMNVLLVEEYIKRGVNVKERTQNYLSLPMDMALAACSAGVGNIFKPKRIVELLLRKGARLKPEGVQELYKYPNAEEYSSLRLEKSVLHDACRGDTSPDVIELLAKHDLDCVNMKCGSTAPLHELAQYDGRFEVVKCIEVLLGCGADLNLESNHRDNGTSGYDCCLTPLGYAVESQSWPLTKALLNHNPSLYIGNAGGHRRSVLHVAIWNDFLDHTSRGNPLRDKESVNFLKRIIHHPVIRDRDLINHTDFQGLTPLATAVHLALPHTVKCLIEHHATRQGVEQWKASDRVFKVIDLCLERRPSFTIEDDLFKGQTFRAGGRPIPFLKFSEYRAKLEQIKSLLLPYRRESSLQTC